MKQCNVCGTVWHDMEPVCRTCGNDISRISPLPPQQVPRTQMMASQQQFIPPAQFRGQRAFCWADICTLVGFISSIIGFFWGSILLLPLGLTTSVLGFRGDRTRGLAVAGIVISIVGIVIKLVSILYEATYLPGWFTNGVW